VHDFLGVAAKVGDAVEDGGGPGNVERLNAANVRQLPGRDILQAEHFSEVSDRTC
jgi:hypothetical protein